MRVLYIHLWNSTSTTQYPPLSYAHIKPKLTGWPCSRGLFWQRATAIWHSAASIFLNEQRGQRENRGQRQVQENEIHCGGKWHGRTERMDGCFCCCCLMTMIILKRIVYESPVPVQPVGLRSWSVRLVFRWKIVEGKAGVGKQEYHSKPALWNVLDHSQVHSTAMCRAALKFAMLPSRATVAWLSCLTELNTVRAATPSSSSASLACSINITSTMRIKYFFFSLKFLGQHAIVPMWYRELWKRRGWTGTRPAGEGGAVDEDVKIYMTGSSQDLIHHNWFH